MDTQGTIQNQNIQSQNQSIIVYPSLIKSLGLLLGSVCFMGIAIWMLIVNGFNLLTILILFFFTFVAIFYLYMVVIRKPILIINKSGIYDHASAVGVGWIRWEALFSLFRFNHLIQVLL